MDELRRIERQYGCVAEYNRRIEEEAGRSSKQKRQARIWYEENRRRSDEYEKAGYRPIAEAFCDIEECRSCKNRTETFYSGEDDDIGVFFCLDNKCEHYINEGSEKA